MTGLIFIALVDIVNMLRYQLENEVCEAIECNAKAVKTLKVNAGTYGQITLFLCSKCVKKFNEVKVK